MSLLYSSKVMKHFLHPKNMGKIKNADGIGKVGNIVCLLPHQNIHLKDGLTTIEKIPKGALIFSCNGRYSTVSETTARNYKGEILAFKNKLGLICLTPDHLLLAIKLPKGDRFLRTKNRKRLISAWYHANQLKKGDIILYPLLKERKDIQYIKFDIPKLKYDFKSRDIPHRIPINFDFLRLMGYFLAEGHAQDKPTQASIIFALNIKEDEIVNDIEKISKNLFGIPTIIRKLPERRTVTVSINSSRLARFFKKLFGAGAESKAVPDFVMNLPLEKQKSLIYGLWKGDGYVNLNRDSARAEFVTISYKLVQQVKILLLRQKIVPSIYTEKAKEINGVNHKKAYRIHVGQRDSLKRLCLILGIEYTPRSRPSEKAWFDDNYLYIPITDIKKQKYKGRVYNLEVQNFHSFVSEAFCLHNCGDVMWLYIKVGKNKSGKEIIKDIKFETFGCVAALATSSVITELAKNKTLDKALKINRAKIVKNLGGLPLIKIHCSVLAADALSEAIYDYLIKNKRKISQELQKKHEKVGKEKNVIEERYEDWVGLEEKIHNRKHS